LRISAHLTQKYRNPTFFSSNRLYLDELESLLNLIENMLENYSVELLGRYNDTKNSSTKIIQEIKTLFLNRAEQPN